MAYVDLGHYTSPAAPDMTGLNSGNLTTVITTSAISVPFFECYRMILYAATVISTPTPFIVAVNGMSWDTQITNTGGIYTYDMNQPMPLADGAVITVAWTALSVASYGSQAKNLQVATWFRYDPNAQPS